VLTSVLEIPWNKYAHAQSQVGASYGISAGMKKSDRNGMMGSKIKTRWHACLKIHWK